MIETTNGRWSKILLQAMVLAAAAALAFTAVSFAASGADEAILNNIRKSYNPYDGISISIHNGEVTLKGEAPSKAVKDEAVARASKIEGVRSVKDEVRVASFRNADSGVDKIDDEAITARIKTAFVMDRDIVSKGIRVKTRDGVVLLSGNVKSGKQCDMAEKRARKVKGVKDVDNRIRVD